MYKYQFQYHYLNLKSTWKALHSQILTVCPIGGSLTRFFSNGFKHLKYQLTFSPPLANEIPCISWVEITLPLSILVSFIPSDDTVIFTAQPELTIPGSSKKTPRQKNAISVVVFKCATSFSEQITWTLRVFGELELYFN